VIFGQRLGRSDPLFPITSQMPEIFVTYEPDLFLMDQKTANGTTRDLLKAIVSSAVCMPKRSSGSWVVWCRGASRDPNMTLVRESTVKSIGKPDVLHHYNQTPTTDVLDAMETFEHPLCWKESLRGSLRCVPPSNSAAFFGSRFPALSPPTPASGALSAEPSRLSPISKMRSPTAAPADRQMRAQK
jgi:hypothetical protein